MHDDAVSTALRDAIIAAARAERTLTYAQLLDAVDDTTRHAARDDLASYLRAISVAEDEQQRGLLTAIVVRDDGMPGAGWFKLAAARGRDVDGRDPAEMWRAEVRAVFDAWRER